MHNHDGGGRGWGGWGMILVCFLPILIGAIWVFGGRTANVPSWFAWGGIILMMGLHMFMMGGSHKHSDSEHSMTNGGDNNVEQKGDKKSGSGGECCH